MHAWNAVHHLSHIGSRGCRNSSFVFGCRQCGANFGAECGGVLWHSTLCEVAIARYLSGTMGSVSGEGETEYWLSVLGIRDSLAQSGEDIAVGNTYGEAEVRALLDDMRTELAAADANFASGNTVSGMELRRRYGLS